MKRFAAIASLLTLSVAYAQDLGRLEEMLPKSSVPTGTAVKVSLVVSHLKLQPGAGGYIAVVLKIPKGWVFYSPDPGQFAKPGGITARSEGLVIGQVLWPADHAKVVDIAGELVRNNVYEGRAVVYVPVRVPASAKMGDHEVSLTLTAQACDVVKGTCVPIMRTLKASVVVSDVTAVNPAWAQDEALEAGLAEAMSEQDLKRSHLPQRREVSVGSREAPRLGVWSGLGLAVLAGLILNVMPCVLPVIPLRIVSLVQMAGASRRRYVTLGLAFAGGIMLFFVILAAANAGLRLAAQQAFNWGEHFQLPAVRIGLALVVIALAANLFGLYTVVVPRAVAGIEARTAGRRGGHLGSIGMGLMMAILSTPCSFAILALALAWAQLQPLWLGTVAILLIGAGMAAPHALLSAFPELLSVMPKPGPWMEKLKQTMGFALLPVAVWLIGTLTEDSYVAWVFAYGVVLTFGLWVWGSWVRYDAPFRRKLAVRGAVVLMLVVSGWWMLRPPKPLAVRFEAFDVGRIDSARRQGRTVLVKFTAAWCLSCKVVDAMIYNDPEIAEQLARRAVVAIKADVTDAETTASKYLTDRFGGSPPLTVIYPPGHAEPILLEGKFSRRQLLEALDRAARLAVRRAGAGPGR